MESDGVSKSQAKGAEPVGNCQEKNLRGDSAAPPDAAAVPMLSSMEVADEPEKVAPRAKEKDRNAYKVLSLVRTRRSPQEPGRARAPSEPAVWCRD